MRLESALLSDPLISRIRSLKPQYKKGEEARSVVKDSVGFLRNQYGLRVSMHRFTREDHPGVDFDKPKLLEAAQVLPLLVDEISKYPREYIDNIGVTEIRLVRDLKNNDESCSGVATGNGVIYLDLNTVDWHLRSSVHHELFHISDMAYGIDIPQMALKLDPNQTARVTRSVLAFSQGVYQDNLWDKTKPHPAFATQYARKNIFEDRADTAALLMAEPERTRNKAIANSDFMRKVIAIYQDFEERSLGLMDDSFFCDLMGSDVDVTYWQN